MLQKIDQHLANLEAYEKCGSTKCVAARKAYTTLLDEIGVQYNKLPNDKAIEEKPLDTFRKKRLFNNLNKDYIQCLRTTKLRLEKMDSEKLTFKDIASISN